MEKEKMEKGIYNLIAEDIDKVGEGKGKQIIDVRKTYYWATGGCSSGFYLEPEHHSSSRTIRLVVGKKESLKRYIILLYLTNLDERGYTSVIERCRQSFNGSRCHKYINTICNYTEIKPCSDRDNHFYEHIGEFESTLKPELETKEGIFVKIKPYIKLISTFKNLDRIIDLDEIKNFNIIKTKGIVELVKKFYSQIRPLLKTVNDNTSRIRDYEGDKNCDFITHPKRLKRKSKILQNLYYQRAQKLTRLNSVSSSFLKNLNKYLYRYVFSLTKKDIFDVYSK